MNIHEFQAKQLLQRYGVPVPRGAVADSAGAAEAVARELGGARWAVKAQVHAGGRGRAGGVRLADTPEQVRAAADALLGTRLVTQQTGPAGKPVRRVYVEEAVPHGREIYLAALVDRAAARVAIIAAKEGGEDIEAKAAADPALIQRMIVDPDTGFDDEAATALAGRLGLADAQVADAVAIMRGLHAAFLASDAGLIEVNPLVATEAGALLALDVKMVLDDNALFRHTDLEALRDADEVDPTELEAKRFELNYVKLDGDIGVMVNGAGLALATVDLLHQSGGTPADFMDVRPTATRAQIAHGFAMLLNNPAVKAILVNVYGGGVLRCDTVAEGIAEACKSRGLHVPLIVRAAGTNREMAQKILTGQGIAVSYARNMADAAAKAVHAARMATAGGAA
jgi:succinyl-CoA synthetase beta subunit